ncbi:FAD-binding and (Fe-S)-binding domain-containing protein [Actinotalea sp.]|uniref:FAD-binding and (Fe-S)-binding domain-containing protein n=1 Tax=Actinotalea sp. TaxID=1872145 RepID=UPI003569E545
MATLTPAAGRPLPVSELAARLGAAVRGEVHTSTLRRAEYSTDASNYRVVPEVVVVPSDVGDLSAVVEIARQTGTPLTLRGGGTSVAGNAVGPGIVVDTSRYLTAIGPIDTEDRTAFVEPGVVMSELQAAAAPFGLRFGPDPSTQNRATLGGMIGNNACGPHAVAYGRTADNVVALDVVDGRGRRFTARRGPGALDAVPGLAELVEANLHVIRTELGRFGRQVSGYSLEHLLPENGTDLAAMLVGSEGTLVTVLGATVRLVPIADAAVLVVLGYPDMASAADAVPALLAHEPLAVEGLDARLVDVVRRAKGAGSVPELPEGGGWLMVEMGGADREDALARATALVADAGTPSVRVLPPGPEASAMWKIRADGAGLGGRTPSGAQAWPGWEDAAVPPAHLGAYLRAFESLMAEHGVDGLHYGHFGDGCVHVRLDLPLEREADVAGFRAFLEASARLVVEHGGSLSGEHGDGRARSELLSTMYSPQARALFAAVKDLFDPEDVLNPGVIVRPRPLDADLRRPHAAPLGRSGFAFAHDGGDLTTAVHRCVGVGKCRADSTDAGGFMCPSYLATRDEKDSTRGRARVLQEMANGTLVTGGWRAPEVHEALDLCLSCKACSSDCPAGVDMAQYKAEVLHRAYSGRLRPMNHYALGWLPRWTRLVARLRLARVANAALGWRPLGALVLRLGGMDTRRSIPRFAPTTFRQARARNGGAEPVHSPVGVGEPTAAESLGTTDVTRRVVLWTDSFSDAFDPAVPAAMVTVLQDAGYEVIVPDEDACCGLTWISTGQLDGARRRLTDLLGVLGPFATNGIPIVGIEPSCTAVLRSDLLDLLPDDPRAAVVAHATHTLAELLTAEGPRGPLDWDPPSLEGLTVLAQPHCHQHAVMGYQADLALLDRAGATVQTIAGCCGLAGNFGMEKGHYEVSVAVAENGLLPALRAAEEGTVLLADGFSCRTQADQLAAAQGVHLAQLLADRLPSARSG